MRRTRPDRGGRARRPGVCIRSGPAVRLDLDTARPRKFSGRPGRHDLAAEQDDDAVTDELDLAQQVRVEQHGDAAPLQLLEQRPHGTPPNRIEGARRFVEKQQPRRPDERLGDPESLLHPLRHRFDGSAARVQQADQLEQLAALLFAAVRARQTLVEQEQLVGVHPARETEELRQIAHR